MSHILEATYEDGVLRLDTPLPLKNQEKVRVTVESLTKSSHSILQISPVSLGSMLEARPGGVDLLEEMLEGRP